LRGWWCTPCEARCSLSPPQRLRYETLDQFARSIPCQTSTTGILQDVCSQCVFASLNQRINQAHPILISPGIGLQRGLKIRDAGQELAAFNGNCTQIMVSVRMLRLGAQYRPVQLLSFRVLTCTVASQGQLHRSEKNDLRRIGSVILGIAASVIQLDLSGRHIGKNENESYSISRIFSS